MRYPCAHCNRHFGSEGALQQHQRDAPMHPKSVHCGICKRSYRSEEAFQQHERDSAAHQTSPNCGVCKRTFGSEEALQQHRRDAHGNNVALAPAASRAVEQGPEARDMMALLSSLHLQQQAPVRSSNHEATRARSKKAEKAIVDSEEETRTFFTFPNLHKRVKEAVFPGMRSKWFYEDDDCDNDVYKQHSTFVMGNFVCRNHACKKKGWSSGKVSLLIRGYARNGYSATVFNQRCKACNHLGTFELDVQSYVERIAYRLKRWAGVMVEQPFYSGKGGPPHERKFCEGCKQGFCEEGLPNQC